MDMGQRISTCGSCTMCFKFNRLQDGRNFRKIYKYAMKPIEVNSLPDRRSAVALELSQFLYRFGRKHRHSSRPRHISLAPPSPRSIISVSSHLAIRQIPRSFVAAPSPARPPLVPSALALIDSAGYRTVIKPDESTSPFFVIDAAPPSRRHNLPAVKFREDVLVSSYTVARVCPSAAIKRPSYLLRARPRTIPADPSIGGAIKRWR